VSTQSTEEGRAGTKIGRTKIKVLLIICLLLIKLRTNLQRIIYLTTYYRICCACYHI